MALMRETYPAERGHRLAPQRIQPESTTVWSFPERGAWATHDGRYRGNWSPYVPRNLILRYSRPGDRVLDPFSGGGTTAVEAKLLGRHCLALDLNPDALAVTREHLRFPLPVEHPTSASGVAWADALHLPVATGSIDLLCAHPPYADSLRYSRGLAGDLSHLPPADFLPAMCRFADESLRVLRPGGVCAVLIGDTRRSQHVVPLGFGTIRAFLDAGFVLDDLVIKRQHHTTTERAWTRRSRGHGFLLLAHEYLAILRKPAVPLPRPETPPSSALLPVQVNRRDAPGDARAAYSTTVWTLPDPASATALRRAIAAQFARPGSQILDVAVGRAVRQPSRIRSSRAALSLVTLAEPEALADASALAGYRRTVRSVAAAAVRQLPAGGTLVITARDRRIDGRLEPVGLLLSEDLQQLTALHLKEIVVVPDAPRPADGTDGSHLRIAHRSLLVYRRR